MFNNVSINNSSTRMRPEMADQENQSMNQALWQIVGGSRGFNKFISGNSFSTVSLPPRLKFSYKEVDKFLSHENSTSSHSLHLTPVRSLKQAPRRTFKDYISSESGFYESMDVSQSDARSSLNKTAPQRLPTLEGTKLKTNRSNVGSNSMTRPALPAPTVDSNSAKLSNCRNNFRKKIEWRQNKTVRSDTECESIPDNSIQSFSSSKDSSESNDEMSASSDDERQTIVLPNANKAAGHSQKENIRAEGSFTKEDDSWTFDMNDDEVQVSSHHDKINISKSSVEEHEKLIVEENPLESSRRYRETRIQKSDDSLKADSASTHEEITQRKVDSYNASRQCPVIDDNSVLSSPPRRARQIQKNKLTKDSNLLARGLRKLKKPVYNSDKSAESSSADSEDGESDIAAKVRSNIQAVSIKRPIPSSRFAVTEMTQINKSKPVQKAKKFESKGEHDFIKPLPRTRKCSPHVVLTPLKYTNARHVSASQRSEVANITEKENAPSNKSVSHANVTHEVDESCRIPQSRNANNTKILKPVPKNVAGHKAGKVSNLKVSVNEIVLEFWVIKLKLKSIIVEGSRVDTEVGAWKSSSIVQRISRSRVKTQSGSVYKLIGPMDKDIAEINGLPKKLIEKFNNGFPPGWKKVVENIFKTPARSTRSTMAKPKKTVYLTSHHKCQDRLCGICSHSSDKLEPDKLEPSSLPRTRSGRIVIPRLEYWSHQYCFLRGGKSVIVTGTPGNIVEIMLPDSATLSESKSSTEKLHKSAEKENPAAKGKPVRNAKSNGNLDKTKKILQQEETFVEKDPSTATGDSTPEVGNKAAQDSVNKEKSQEVKRNEDSVPKKQREDPSIKSLEQNGLKSLQAENERRAVRKRGRPPKSLNPETISVYPNRGSDKESSFSSKPDECEIQSVKMRSRHHKLQKQKNIPSEDSAQNPPHSPELPTVACSTEETNSKDAKGIELHETLTKETNAYTGTSSDDNCQLICRENPYEEPNNKNTSSSPEVFSEPRPKQSQVSNEKLFKILSTTPNLKARLRRNAQSKVKRLEKATASADQTLDVYHGEKNADHKSSFCTRRTKSKVVGKNPPKDQVREFNSVSSSEKCAEQNSRMFHSRLRPRKVSKVTSSDSEGKLRNGTSKNSFHKVDSPVNQASFHGKTRSGKLGTNKRDPKKNLPGDLEKATKQPVHSLRSNSKKGSTDVLSEKSEVTPATLAMSGLDCVTMENCSPNKDEQDVGVNPVRNRDDLRKKLFPNIGKARLGLRRKRKAVTYVASPYSSDDEETCVQVLPKHTRETRRGKPAKMLALTEEKANTKVVKKPPVVTAGKGTLARRNQMRDYLKFANEGNKVDMFADSDLGGVIPQIPQLLGDEESSSEDDVNAMTSKTPPTCLQFAVPRSARRTPVFPDYMNPRVINTVERKAVDKYIHNRRKKGQVSQPAERPRITTLAGLSDMGNRDVPDDVFQMTAKPDNDCEEEEEDEYFSDAY